MSLHFRRKVLTHLNKWKSEMWISTILGKLGLHTFISLPKYLKRIIPVSHHPGHWCGMVHTGQCSLQGCRVHTERWWDWQDGSSSCPIPDLVNVRKGFTCYIHSYISTCQHAQARLQTFHEDLRSHGATRAVSTIRWHRGARDCWDWKDTVKGQWVRILEKQPRIRLRLAMIFRF